MKFPAPNPRRLVIDCLLLFLAHAALLEVMARTRIIENVMALQFSRWEFALVCAFLIVRLMVYFLVPSLLAALLAREIARRIAARQAE